MKMIGALWQDICYGFRMLIKSPGFTLVTILTLTIAIGATSAIYSVVRTTILDPLPVPDADRLMFLESYNTKEDHDHLGINPVVLSELRANADVFTNLAYYRSVHAKFQGKEFIELIPGARVSPNFFSFWQTPPAMGRLFTVDENQPGAEKVVILSDRVWRKLGGDPAIIGKSVELSGDALESQIESYIVVGVMPPHFKFPNADVGFWRPGSDPAVRIKNGAPDPMQYWLRNYNAIFRVPKDKHVEQAQVILDTISLRHTEHHKMYNEGWRMRVLPVSRMFADDKVRRTLWTLFAVIGFVWLIACANVASLLLARSEARQHEMTVRGALGAGRARLVRQLLTESLLLAIIGGLSGFVLTSWGIHALDVFLGGIRMKPFQLNWIIFVSSMAVALITGIVFGLAPAWHGSRSRLQETMKQAFALTTRNKRGRLLARGLIVGEVALAVVLLSAAGLMVQSVIRLLRVDVGYRPDNLLMVHVRPPFDKYSFGDRERHTMFMNNLYERLSTLPGVVSVGIWGGYSGEREYTVVGENQSIRIVREGCGLEKENPFTTLGASLIDGRFLNRTDRERDTVVVIETLAKAFWPDQSTIGKRIRSLPKREWGHEEWEIVGVVGNTKLYAYDREPKPTFFRPSEETYGGGPAHFFFIRTQIESASMILPIQLAIKEVEPEVFSPSIEIVSDQLYKSTQSRRTFTFYLTLFAGVGLSLAAIGLYGILAYAVTRRTREMGIRMAMGATPKMVRNILLCEGIKLIFIGLGCGLIGSLCATRLLQSQLFDISPQDPAMLAIMSVFLLLVAAMACFIPARRATKIDPMEALRYE
jgi:putative ABC transport system permease protein